MIKNIIFDVGNVLLEFRWQDMLSDHGAAPQDIQRIGEELFPHPIWWKELDGGEISLREAIQKYGRLYPWDRELIAWFLENAEQMAVPRPRVWEKMAQLKKAGYCIYILSNYSEELFRKHTEGASFFQYLDGGIVSWQVHLLKPDVEIYQALLDKYSLRPEECLFFDDKEENVAGSEKAGIQAIQVMSQEMLLEELEKLLEKENQET